MTAMWVDDADANEPIDPTPYAATGDDICGEDAQDNIGLTHLCDRDPGHSGRHMALTFEDGDTPFVVAAWPGDWEPNEEDL